VRRAGSAVSPQGTGSSGPLLQIISGLGVGGAERATLELTLKVHAAGREASIIGLNSDRQLLEQYRDVPFEVVSLGLNHDVRSWPRVLFQLTKLVKLRRPSIVHAHMFHGLLAGLWCRLIHPSIKLVFTSHSFAGFSLSRRMVIRATKWLRDADVIFSSSQHSDLNAPRSEIIPNGVAVDDESGLVRQPGKYVFLFVGRLVPLKNPLGLVDAFAKANIPSSELWMAGEGPLRDALEHQISQRGLSRRVRLLGLRKDVRTVLRQAQCLVVPSQWEGLPLSALEAGAEGLPVIATPVGALPELLSDGRGFLTDLENMPQVMRLVVSRSAEAAERGARLRERVKTDFSLEACGIKHLQLYGSLLGTR
jgi:glycosyltransferase involved in cell wall biosynthesis